MAEATSCRLCSFTCDDFKRLFDESGERNVIYQITAKYFSPSLLESGVENSLKVICVECWQHIVDFHSFQQWILNAQIQLDEEVKHIKQEETMTENQISNFEIIDDLKEDSSPYTKNSSKLSLDNIVHDKEKNDNHNYPDEEDHDFITKIRGKFKCDKCNELFSSYVTLEGHLQKFHFDNESNFLYRRNENPFICETCGASFTLNGNLKRHMRRKHAGQSFFKWICKYCKKMFKCRLHLENHKRKSHITQLKTDAEFTQVRSTKSMDEDTMEEINIDKRKDTNFTENQNTFNINEEPFQGDFVSSSAEVNSSLQIIEPSLDIIDIKSENSSDIAEAESSTILTKNIDYDEYIRKLKSDLECPKCCHQVTNYTQLHEHFTIYHPEERCYIICCQSALYERQTIVEHLQLHENANTFKCPECGKCFNNSRGLTSHKLQVHSDNRSAYHLHVCYCKKDKELHEDSKEKEYNANVCCSRKKKILEDDALIAEWKKELRCEICNSVFFYYSLMRAHYYREHPGEKCYISCCQRKMSRVSDVIAHIRFHLDPHAFRCQICNIIFSGRSTLTKHMRNTHNNYMPKHRWACDKCDKTFEIRQILTRHKNVAHSKQV
ncbi:uncharacterized protein ACRADG_007198 [Cochliomyia hominivorax]